MTQNQAIDSIVAGFEKDLKPIVAAARRAVIQTLTKRLSVTDGVLAKTMTNARILRTTRALFEQEMRRAGYSDLVDSFITKFDGAFTYFDKHLADLSKQVGKDVSVSFGQRDQDYFHETQLNSIHLLDGVVEDIAQNVQRQAMLSVGGIKFADLISAIADQCDRTVAEAVTVADTAITSWYRTITNRGYQIIEKDLPSFEIRYKFDNPLDKCTRPFCRKLILANLSYSRAEIDAMDNLQGLPVWTFGGGWRCRGQFYIALDEKP